MSKTATPASLDYLREELPHIYHSNSIELSDVQQAMDYYAPVFYGSKLSEVKGLPSDEQIKAACCTDETAEGIVGAKWMRSIAQQVIAKKDELINQGRDGTKELLRQIKELDSELNKAKEQLIEADKTHKFLDGLIDKSISREAAIKVELDKAKEEIERLKANQNEDHIYTPDYYSTSSACTICGKSQSYHSHAPL